MDIRSFSILTFLLLGTCFNRSFGGNELDLDEKIYDVEVSPVQHGTVMVYLQTKHVQLYVDVSYEQFRQPERERIFYMSTETIT